MQPAQILHLGTVIYFPEKNQLPLFPAPPLPPPASFCNPLIVGIIPPIPPPIPASPAAPPPPRRGLAILEPALLNEKPVGEPKPRVEPDLAASRRSFTAVSWASNLFQTISTYPP